MDQYFWSVKFSSLLKYAWWFAIYEVYFHLGEIHSKKYVSSDPHNNCFPLKLVNLVHFEIS